MKGERERSKLKSFTCIHCMYKYVDHSVQTLPPHPPPTHTLPPHTHTLTHLQVYIMILTQQLEEAEKWGHTQQLRTAHDAFSRNNTDDTRSVHRLSSSCFCPPSTRRTCCRSNQRQLFLGKKRGDRRKI